MKSLFPIFKDDNKNLMLLQTKWSQIFNQFFSNPIFDGILLEDQVLGSGDNVIPHLLGRPLLGYIVTSQNAAAQFFQKPSQMPNLTFIINSSAPCIADFYVF